MTDGLIKPFGGRDVSKWRNSRYRRVLSDNGGADEHFANVVLLMNFEDGTDPYKDYSLIGATATEVGASNAVTTSDFKFGTTSYDATANSYLTFPANDAYDIGTSLFTAEAWVKSTNWSACSCPFFARDGEYVFFNYGFGTYGRVRVGGWRDDTGAFLQNLSHDLLPAEDVDNEWRHSVFMGDGSTIYIFLDGVLIYSAPYVLAGYETGTANPLLFGYATSTYGSYFTTGTLVDSVRITMDVARYDTAGFDVPTSAFPTS